jgi:hypothetical protein
MALGYRPYQHQMGVDLGTHTFGRKGQLAITPTITITFDNDVTVRRPFKELSGPEAVKELPAAPKKLTGLRRMGPMMLYNQ